MELLSMPTQMFLFTKLTELNLSHNKLREIPSSIKQLVSLRRIYLSHNQLQCLPDNLHRLTQLVLVDASFNPIKTVLASIAHLTNLILLDLSHTNVQSIPAELLDLSMVTIRTDHCRNLLDAFTEHDLVYNPSSLFELCARELIQPILYHLMTKKKKLRILEQALDMMKKKCPDHILVYLSAPSRCSSCGGPYFKHYLVRYRLVQRQNELLLPIEYKLCSAHWNTEDERILDMFSFRPRLSLPKSNQACSLQLN